MDGLDHRVPHTVHHALQVGPRTDVWNAPQELRRVELVKTSSGTVPSSGADRNRDRSRQSHDRTQHLALSYPRIKARTNHTHDASPKGAASEHPISGYCIRWKCRAYS